MLCCLDQWAATIGLHSSSMAMARPVSAGHAMIACIVVHHPFAAMRLVESGVHPSPTSCPIQSKRSAKSVIILLSIAQEVRMLYQLGEDSLGSLSRSSMLLVHTGIRTGIRSVIVKHYCCCCCCCSSCKSCGNSCKLKRSTEGSGHAST